MNYNIRVGITKNKNKNKRNLQVLEKKQTNVLGMKSWIIMINKE